MVAGHFGRDRTKVSPYDLSKLKKDDLISEVSERNLLREISFAGRAPKRENYERVLKEHLQGSVRVPAICFGHQDETLENTFYGGKL